MFKWCVCASVEENQMQFFANGPSEVEIKFLVLGWARQATSLAGRRVSVFMSECVCVYARGKSGGCV
jgi:hypothetical protein